MVNQKDNTKKKKNLAVTIVYFYYDGYVSQ